MRTRLRLRTASCLSCSSTRSPPRPRCSDVSAFRASNAKPQAGDGTRREHGAENKSNDGLDRDDSFSRMLADCKLEHLLLSPSKQPIPPRCNEDGTERHTSNGGLSRDDSFSRMLAASKLQNSLLEASSAQPAPSPPPPPPPPPSPLTFPTPPHSSSENAFDMAVSSTPPSKPTPRLDTRGPTRNGSGLDEPIRRPQISGLRVWGGPASQPPPPTLSPPACGGGSINGKRVWEAKVSQPLPSDSVRGNAWNRRNFGRPPFGSVPQHPRDEPTTNGPGPAESRRWAQSGGGRASGGADLHSLLPPLGQPPRMGRKRKSPEWSPEHPAAGGNNSPASHENPDWFRGN